VLGCYPVNRWAADSLGLGRGGMGEVYRAHDKTLRRDVALKLVAPELAADATARARLTREARMLAALNIPIDAIYSFDSAADRSLPGARAG